MRNALRILVQVLVVSLAFWGKGHYPQHYDVFCLSLILAVAAYGLFEWHIHSGIALSRSKMAIGASLSILVAVGIQCTLLFIPPTF